MRESGYYKKIKMFIASIGFRLFIWGNETTEEDYWDEICDQEKSYRARIENEE